MGVDPFSLEAAQLDGGVVVAYADVLADLLGVLVLANGPAVILDVIAKLVRKQLHVVGIKRHRKVVARGPTHKAAHHVLFGLLSIEDCADASDELLVRVARSPAAVASLRVRQQSAIILGVVAVNVSDRKV